MKHICNLFKTNTIYKTFFFLISIISINNFYSQSAPTDISITSTNLDENNIIMSKHTVDTCPKQIKTLEENGVNVIPLEFDVSRWLNQGIHCLSNPLVRDGGLINYF